MKQNILILAFLLFFLNIQSQEKTYFDSKWNPTTKENAVYYRILKKENNLYNVKDYYIDGKIQFEGYSKVDSEPLTMEGTSIWYFKNGKIQRKANFKDNLPHGKSISYYSNGKIQSESEYNNNVLNGYYRNYFPSGKLQAEVEFINGEMNGRYIKYHSETKIEELMHYQKGILEGPIETYKRGIPEFKAFAKNGLPEGEIVNYHYNSDQVRSRYKITNQYLDYLYEFSKKGDTIGKGIFEAGKPIYYKSLFKDLNGSTFSLEMKLIKDVENWKIYRDEKLVYESFYQNGKRIGTWKFYNYDGTKLYLTIDFSNSDCDEKEEYLQKVTELKQYFNFSDRFKLVDKLFKTKCEDASITKFFENDSLDYENEHPLYFSKSYLRKTEDGTSKGPKIDYKKVSAKKDGENGYAIKYEGVLAEDYLYQDPLDKNFLKMNLCNSPYSKEHKDIVTCEKLVDNVKYILFASENRSALLKLKNQLIPKDDEILFFYQKYEDRIYKKGDKMDRYIGFTIPDVIKEAYAEEIMKDMDIIYVCESLFFEPENFNGSNAYDALKEELKK